ncbi:nitrogenase component 1 [Desulforhabdus amnigena]|uniref:Nitrogenase n=1 Tax=Desulforhabdus amnigena TaxID=40218 RepID=A0A9W6D0C5_9BACT|nr:nitrogenase component 1 [Desulforhabdus amnigena]NLJ29025.1 nitrogenase [Deltaproteobacteria bacterium]GLI33682.1 nitrogenase [Desulforhabdus amnigena]
MKRSTSPYVSTTNACKLCKPMGACLAFRGIEGAVPFLHGSQGCATYMRRYIISHYREPMDIASSSLGEKHAVYGGEANLKQGLQNVMAKYGADLIGIATTCLTETIGDDVPMIVRAFRKEMAETHQNDDLPSLVNVSTPSYSGTHMEGFHAAVKSVVDQLAGLEEKTDAVNVLPGFVSPADIRYLKEIMEDFGLPPIVLPDISETLDGPAAEEYEKIPLGGTPIAHIKNMGGSRATIEFGRTLARETTAGRLLEDRFGVKLHGLGMPMGLRETDRFFEALEEISGSPTLIKHASERGRLIDAYVDGHKYLSEKRAVIYGEEDLVVGLTSFLVEIGIKPVLCASGGRSGHFREAIEQVTGEILSETPIVKEGVDFYEIAEEVEALSPELLVGHSKGYHLAKKWNIPLVRVGFPIHDRFGGQRILHLGYRGAQNLLDRIVNALIEKKQMDSSVGYGYM